MNMIRGTTLGRYRRPIAMAAIVIVTAVVVRSCIPFAGPKGRAIVRLAQSKSALLIIGKAIEAYTDSNSTPCRDRIDKAGQPLLSWRVQLLPYFDFRQQELQELYAQFHLDEPWDSPHNMQLANRMPLIFGDPRLAHTAQETTRFVAVDPTRLICESRERTSTDTRTPIVVEVPLGDAVIWTRPDSLLAVPKQPSDLDPNEELILYSDGTVSKGKP